MDIEKTIKNLESRGFKVSYFATDAEAADYVCGAVGGGSVGIGGSKTIEKLGLYERLSETNDVYWHWRTPGAETLRQEISADYFLSSANAISEDGEILNIDGNGNRVAATLFGHKKVFIISGTNNNEV